MKSALIIIDKAPYGYEDAFSGFYVAIACLNRDLDADVVLINDGVYAAMEDQESEENIKFPNVGELCYLIFPEGSLFVHEKSMQERGIGEEELVEAAEVINDQELYEIIRSKTIETAIIKI